MDSAWTISLATVSVGGRQVLPWRRCIGAQNSEVNLVGPPAETVTFSQVFTDPGSSRPLLHGYHVQTEGVRFKLNTDILERFVGSELARLKEDAPARRWHSDQMLRFLERSAFRLNSKRIPESGLI